MDHQQESEAFLAKFLKAIHDIRNDFNDLSPENQQRFAQEANTILKVLGYAFTIDDLMWNSWLRK